MTNSWQTRVHTLEQNPQPWFVCHARLHPDIPVSHPHTLKLLPPKTAVPHSVCRQFERCVCVNGTKDVEIGTAWCWQSIPCGHCRYFSNTGMDTVVLDLFAVVKGWSLFVRADHPSRAPIFFGADKQRQHQAQVLSVRACLAFERFETSAHSVWGDSELTDVFRFILFVSRCLCMNGTKGPPTVHIFWSWQTSLNAEEIRSGAKRDKSSSNSHKLKGANSRGWRLNAWTCLWVKENNSDVLSEARRLTKNCGSHTVCALTSPWQCRELALREAHRCCTSR